MPTLNFMKQFAQLVESGEKRQTIRSMRLDGLDPKAGQTLFLYTGLQTKSCRKLGESKCLSSDTIFIISYDTISINGKELCHDSIALLSSADGFDHPRRFVYFFERAYGLPFWGKLIKWGDLYYGQGAK